MILGGGLIATLIFAPRGWVAIVAVAMAIATHEVVRRLREGGYDIPLIPLLVGGQAMVWLDVAVRGGRSTGRFRRHGRRLPDLAVAERRPQQPAGELPARCVGDCVSGDVDPAVRRFRALLIYHPDGSARVFALMLGVVLSDIGGYSGCAVREAQDGPGDQSQEVVEGFAGSLICGTTAAVLAVVFLLHKPAWVGIPLGIMLVITATLGDLVESQVKRDLGIKDMGTLLPGHGGLMDRIDGVMPSAVATWIVLTLLT